jgi:eukaryotic-like serine/threonine-protein kinase
MDCAVPELSVVGSSRPAPSARALETLDGSFGPVPRVLLRDTDNGYEEPVVKLASQSVPDAPGRYQVFGEIARGGMGAVFKGRDPDLGRDLAVKVLLDRHSAAPDLVRRFVEEAQIGGQLQHPGVVPVYELGTFADSRPYFTMKLVKGRTLAELLGERKAQTPELPRFLGIFEHVCQTVAYAHARGVIHRDLKPPNIMVGSFGEVQVMDWGLAKILKDGGLADEPTSQPALDASVIATLRSGSDVDNSQVGSVLGTPAYMAPEQAAGDIERVDRRADVFGLGSILCEILTSQPAYSGRSQPELIRKAMRGDTSDAIERLARCGAEAELVALANDCLAIESDDRPRDAGLVAARMTAYLASVQERVQVAERERAVAVARAIEERRRRKLQLGLAASLLAFTTLGGLSATHYLQQKQARAATLDRIVGQTVTLRDQAVLHPEDLARWQVALAAVEQADAGDDPQVHRQLLALRFEIQTGLDAAQRDRILLDRLVDIRSGGGDDGNTSATDDAYTTAFREAGIDLAIMPPAEAGAKIKSRPPTVARDLAASLDDWASWRRKSRPKDVDGARRLAETARVADPDPWRNELRAAFGLPDKTARLVALRGLAKSAKFSELAAVSLHLLGKALHLAGDDVEAESVLRQAQRRHPRDIWINHSLGTVLEALARREEAIRYYTAARSIRPATAHSLAHALDAHDEPDEAIAVFRDLVGIRPDSAWHLSCLGSALKTKGLEPEASNALEAATAAARAAIRKQPDDTFAHLQLGRVLCLQGKLDPAIAEFGVAISLEPDDSIVHFNLATALRDQGKLDRAIAEYTTAIRLRPEHADSHLGLGVALVEQGKGGPAAIAEYRTAIRLKPDYFLGHNNLGAALAKEGKLDEAIAAYRASIRLKPEYASTHNNLGMALKEQGKLDEAIAEFRLAIQLRPDFAEANTELGIALANQGKQEEANAQYRIAIKIKPNYADAHANLGVALANMGDFDEAVAELRVAIRLNPENANAHSNLGLALAIQGSLDDSIAAFRTAIRLKPDLASAYFNLGNTLREQGKLDAAVAAFRSAINIKPDYAEARTNLGLVLQDQGQLDLAIAEFRTAIRQKPDFALAHCNLGLALLRLGDFDGALKCLRKGHSLGSRTPNWSTPSAEWIADAESFVALSPRISPILEGTEKVHDNSERLTLFKLCYRRQQFATAARLAAEALAADPTLADDPRDGHRYNGARAAAMAASGRGASEPPLEDTARIKLRRQALEWLKADLAVITSIFEAASPAKRSNIAAAMEQWKRDIDLAGVREPEALAAMPEEDRKVWRAFWADLDSLLDRAGSRN